MKAVIAIILALSGGIVTFGCNHKESSSEVSVAHSTSEGKSKRHDAALDNEVLGTVLDDLLSYSGENSPLGDQGSPPQEIVFDKNPVQSTQTVSDVLFHYDTDVWEKLTPAQKSASDEAAGNLVRRIRDRDPFGKFEPHDKRVRMVHLDRASQQWQNDDNVSIQDRPVQAWPPGYSKNQHLAVVRLVIPWSIHHAEGTYILWKDQNKWNVCLRQFVYYP